MAAIVLDFEALVLALAIPVLISIADVGTVPLCSPRRAAVAMLLAAGCSGGSAPGYVLGSLVQIGAIGLGFVVPVMFVLGLAFARSSGCWPWSSGAGGGGQARRGGGRIGSRRTAPRRMMRTLVLVKPDAVRRGLVGEILGRFEPKG